MREHVFNPSALYHFYLGIHASPKCNWYKNKMQEAESYMTVFQCTHVLTLDYYMREKGYFSSDHWFLGTRGYYSVDFNLRHKI